MIENKNPMLEFLRRPYPFSFLPLRRIKQILPIGLSVFLLLILFKPFGLENNPDYILFSAYMSTCGAFAGLITTVIIPLIFPLYFNEAKWTIKRNLIWVICINILFATIMFLALNIFLIFRYNASNDFSLRNFLWWVYLQLIFGVPLGIIINLVNQYYLLKKHLKVADNINNSIYERTIEQLQTGWEEDKQKFVSNNDLNSIEFEIDKLNKVTLGVDNLIYVEAMGNYLNILYQRKEINKITIRETLSNIEKKIGNSSQIYQPHRSYLVNLQDIKSVTGNSQGLKIHLKSSDKIIPVSRNKIKEFKLLVTNNTL